jgi:hypothetical protein
MAEFGSKKFEFAFPREEILSPRPDMGSLREECPSKGTDIDFQRE